MSAFLAAALLSSLQDPAPPLELRVDRAIVRAVAWLKSKQSPDGSWPGHAEQHPGGVTALACLALVKAGIEHTDAALAGGLRALSAVDFRSTYSASMHLQLAAALREPGQPVRSETAAVAESSARRSFDLLVRGQKEGLWDYPGGHIDMSNTQFALLGLRAGSELGFEVPLPVLERCATAIFRLQDGAGGFGYGFGDSARGGMTAATLAGVQVIRDLGKESREVSSTLAKRKSRLRAAEAWMESRFDPARPPFGERAWTESWDYSYLWAVERWCGLTSRKEIGGRDWYREGAEHLVARQDPDGDFGGSLDDTCFALLFLRRATITGWEDRSEAYRRIDAEKRATRVAKVAPAAGVPRIAEWLVAGPYKDDRGSPRFAGTDLARLVPRERGKHEDEAFERVALKKDDWTDLEAATGRSGDRMFWILATSLAWEPEGEARAPLDATLWFSFEDPWKIWLDGELLSSEMRTASPIRESVALPARLDPGVHALVVLAADDAGASAFSGRITDRAGNALPPGFTAGAYTPRPRSHGERGR